MKRNRKSPLSASGCADAFCRVAPIAAWWLLAMVTISAVTGSVYLNAVSFQDMAQSQPRFARLPRELWFCFGGFVGLWNAFMVMALQNKRRVRWIVIIAVSLLFLLLALYNWFRICVVFVPFIDGISMGEFLIAGGLFVLQIVSGCFPALVIVLRQTDRQSDTDANASAESPKLDQRRPTSIVAAPVVVPAERRVGSQLVARRTVTAREPGITTIRDLVVYAGRNPECFPEMKFDDSRVMFASLETIGNALGMAKSTVHKHLRKEAAAGWILFDASSRPTKVWIPVDHAQFNRRRPLRQTSFE